MRKAVVVSMIFLLAMTLIIEFGIANSLLIFLISGRVPGTTFMIPANVMLIATGVCLWLLVLWMTVTATFNAIAMRRLVARHSARKARMPKRRFSQI